MILIMDRVGGFFGGIIGIIIWCCRSRRFTTFSSFWSSSWGLLSNVVFEFFLSFSAKNICPYDDYIVVSGADDSCGCFRFFSTLGRVFLPFYSLLTLIVFLRSRSFYPSLLFRQEQMFLRLDGNSWISITQQKDYFFWTLEQEILMRISLTFRDDLNKNLFVRQSWRCENPHWVQDKAWR